MYCLDILWYQKEFKPKKKTNNIEDVKAKTGAESLHMQ